MHHFPRLGRRLGTVIGTLLLTVAASLAAVSVTAAPAHADACYTWSGTLQQGSSGGAVTQLQIRVAGWAASGTVFSIDGSYGPATTTAVRNFQAAYGLAADGVAGANTFNKIYALQDDDCTPVHFAWSEVDDVCYGGWPTPISGVTVAQVKANLMQAMWRAEAIRHRLGDNPLRVTSAYRSAECNRRVGGATNSNHLYGRAIDLVPGSSATTMCGIALAARYTAFRELLGPGYPDHSDHIHLGIQSTKFWRAPNCGI
jgi:zinc D-Ala-D-Ala carboxypeptidase